MSTLSEKCCRGYIVNSKSWVSKVWTELSSESEKWRCSWDSQQQTGAATGKAESPVGCGTWQHRVFLELSSTCACGVWLCMCSAPGQMHSLTGWLVLSINIGYFTNVASVIWTTQFCCYRSCDMEHSASDCTRLDTEHHCVPESAWKPNCLPEHTTTSTLMIGLFYKRGWT